MSFKNIIAYERCDILKHKNDVEKRGYDKDKTLGEMIDLAIINKSKILIKAGTNAKWYLKGKDYEYDFLLGEISENIGKSRKGVICYLIEY